MYGIWQATVVELTWHSNTNNKSTILADMLGTPHNVNIINTYLLLQSFGELKNAVVDLISQQRFKFT